MNKLLGIILVVFLLTFNTDYAYSHSGRTDANGGHHRTATGTYHFHHGYPEHYHDNGFCPYAFDDKTGSSSGGASISSNGGSRNDSGNGLSYFILLSLVLVYIYSAIKQKRDIREKERVDREKAIKYTEEQNYYRSLYEGKSASEIAKVPNNIRFGDDDLPISIDDSGLPWGKEFTVYYAPQGSRYHRKLRCSKANRSIHIYKIGERKSPCSKCVNSEFKRKYLDSYKWYQEYIHIKNIKLKYKID